MAKKSAVLRDEKRRKMYEKYKAKRAELKAALYEARCFIAMQNLKLEFYNARDIINLKTTFGL